MLQRGRHRRIREVRKESKGMVSEELGCLWADSDSLGFCSCWHLRGRGLVYIAIFLGMALDRLRDTAELQDMHIYHAKPFLVKPSPRLGAQVQAVQRLVTQNTTVQSHPAVLPVPSSVQHLSRRLFTLFLPSSFVLEGHTVFCQHQRGLWSFGFLRVYNTNPDLSYYC